MSDTWNIIAADASKSTFLTSIADYSSAGEFAYRIHQVNLIFTAEALAIGTVLYKFASLSTPVIVITDNLSVRSALQSTNLKSPRIILWLYNKIIRITTHTPNIHFWYPGTGGSPLTIKL